MKKLILSALVLSLAITPPIFAEIDQKQPGKQNIGHSPIRQMMRGISLSKDQQAKIKQLESQDQAAMMQSRQKMQGIQQDIMNLVESEKMDTNKLDILVRYQTSLIADQMKLKAQMHHEIYNLLTPEQKVQFKKKEASFKQQHRMRQGMGGQRSEERPKKINKSMPEEEMEDNMDRDPS